LESWRVGDRFRLIYLKSTDLEKSKTDEPPSFYASEEIPGDDSRSTESMIVGTFSTQAILKQAHADLEHPDPKARILAIRYLEQSDPSIILPSSSESLIWQGIQRLESRRLPPWSNWKIQISCPYSKSLLGIRTREWGFLPYGACSRMGEKIDLNIFLQFLSDESPWVRRRLATLLGWGQHEGVFPIVMELCKDADAGVRKAALFSLTTLYPEECENRLVEAMTDPDPDIRKWARGTLERIAAMPRKGNRVSLSHWNWGNNFSMTTHTLPLIQKAQILGDLTYSPLAFARLLGVPKNDLIEKEAQGVLLLRKGMRNGIGIINRMMWSSIATTWDSLPQSNRSGNSSSSILKGNREEQRLCLLWVFVSLRWDSRPFWLISTPRAISPNVWVLIINNTPRPFLMHWSSGKRLRRRLSKPTSPHWMSSLPIWTSPLSSFPSFRWIRENFDWGGYSAPLRRPTSWSSWMLLRALACWISMPFSPPMTWLFRLGRFPFLSWSQDPVRNPFNDRGGFFFRLRKYLYLSESL